MTPTECQCTKAGYCELLRRTTDPEAGRKMSQVRWEECQSKPGYFSMFFSESIAGGGKTQPERSRGLGDTIAKFLSRIGIKKKTGCGCEKRQTVLNRFFPYR